SSSLGRRVAVDVARAAGHLLRDEVSGVRRIAYKGMPTNLVTEMDQRAEAEILARLRGAFPDDAILSEEHGVAAAGSSGRRWIVDPLDGTTNYAHGLPVFGVSIALQAGRRVVLDLAYVACGRFDGFWELRLGSWDVAAGSVLVEEAGGLVTAVDGGPLDVDAPTLLATNGVVHPEMLGVLKEVRG